MQTSLHLTAIQVSPHSLSFFSTLFSGWYFGVHDLSLPSKHWNEMADKAVEKWGKPFFVTPNKSPLLSLFRSQKQEQERSTNTQTKRTLRYINNPSKK